MAREQNTFQRIGWATTKFVQFWGAMKQICLVCLVTKFKTIYLLCDMILIDVLQFGQFINI